MRILTILLLAAVMSFAAAAQPPDVSDLAALVPPDVLLYVEFKTDDASISGIDDLIANLSARIGVEVEDSFSGLSQILGLRTWLGNKGAFVVPPFASPRSMGENFLALLQIRDRALVEAFFEDELEAQRVPVVDGSYSQYIYSGMSVSISDNLLIAARGLVGATLPASAENSLANHAPFTDAMAALPADDYAARIYFDTRALTLGLGGSFSEVFDALAINLPVFADTLGVFGAGITQLDDRSYAFDVAQIYGTRHPFEALYVPPPPSLQSVPIDPGWLAMLPDDVTFIGQGTQPWPQLRALLEAVSVGGNALRLRALVNASLMESELGFDMLDSPLGQIPPSFSSAVVLNTLEGLFSMNDAALSAAFGGQSALAVRIREGSTAPVLDFLLAVESNSLDAGQNIVRGTQSVLPLINLTPSEAGEDGILFDLSDPLLESPLSLLADDDALYFGSDALILANKQTLVAVPRITEAAPFIHDRALFLPDATNLAYVYLPPLREMFGMRSANGDVFLPDTPEFRNLLDLFDSFWISARTESGQTVTRFGFTLSE